MYFNSKSTTFVAPQGRTGSLTFLRESKNGVRAQKTTFLTLKSFPPCQYEPDIILELE